ncbi:M14 family zinc carboxypeptidase [Flavilitoribacter nigricans]|uniref:Zinc carboxypeptidase n=1 Tax=Flavilitoribacter nigricans (strain ATCC 23147 / DSM 23189 / NBRC 102662 / NCIMB 1420 / SS-2) TaxID=1122177 RepID=A0A2D0NI03_FLAN2|nr:M14 family zinc carboxypeptidase [Flavilitoribacter nigricans]PHN08048.1 zinc carboxypeptidase [Flavilitoribacter nigricans DSM 23189 = NBRC 102662]
MQKNILGLLFFALLLPLAGSAQLQSPDDFLPHRLGETFTPHHLLVDYFQHVAANSDRIQLTQYGMTNEKRPLLHAFVSTPENLARLDAIRENNLRRAGVLEGTPDPDLDIAIVWLSFSVHGNEAAGSEASMGVVYDLANPANSETGNWLENTVVILDPSLNPDGYSRYTHWQRGVANLIPNPNPSVREHLEPWPGGRVNHYLFDLNRDWAWQTQVESQQRLKVYQQWLPQIHADLHEQYYDSPYYFAPAARPYHKYITDWQADFQVEIGKNHAKYFDKNGWLYFTKEVFDLFYPSYGDTYPTFTGAIGMTYEQGGHSRGGRAIIAPNRDTLTLLDRVTHHRTTALSTVEVASVNSERLLNNYTSYYQESQRNPKGKYRTYIIKGDNPQGKLKAFTELLDKNGIRYGRASGTSVSAYNYQNGSNGNISVADGDLIISAYQPLSTLTQVLMDPTAELEDSLTYDITSWSLPYAYGLEAYATTQRLSVSGDFTFPDTENARSTVEDGAYAYLASWASMKDASFLADLLRRDLLVRYASSPFAIEGESYPAGTLVITRSDNRKKQDFVAIVRKIAGEHGISLTSIQTGFSDQGQDLGSDAMRIVEPPKIAVLSGEGTSANGFGQVWYYFEQRLGYPIGIYDADNIGRIDLNDYNTLVMPEGRYRLSESNLKEIQDWVSGGGRLIALGYANSALAGKSGFNLSEFATDKDEKDADQADEKATLDSRYDDYAGAARRRISRSLPGAIFKLKMDETHPLAFGLSDEYFSLKTSTLHYAPMKNSWNVGVIGENPMVSGFVGAQALEQMKNTVVYGVQERGGGSIVYLVDNPLFRGFWENGLFLFSNALFLR